MNNDWKEIKSLCGRDFPSPVNSTSPRMKILFRSNSATTADGFKAKWEQNCGGTIYASEDGTILSPGYPIIYPNMLHCIYKFEAPSDHINFNFTFFDLEGRKLKRQNFCFKLKATVQKLIFFKFISLTRILPI